MAVKTDVQDANSGATMGDRIEEAAKEAGMSVKDLARTIGVPLRTFQRHVGGVTDKLPATVAVKVSNATGFSVQWIVNGDGPRRTVPPSVKERTFDEIVRLVQEASVSDEDGTGARRASRAVRKTKPKPKTPRRGATGGGGA